MTNTVLSLERMRAIIISIIVLIYWMRLSRMWIIRQIEEDVIHRGWRPRWITFPERIERWTSFRRLRLIGPSFQGSMRGRRVAYHEWQAWKGEQMGKFAHARRTIKERLQWRYCFLRFLAQIPFSRPFAHPNALISFPFFASHPRYLQSGKFTALWLLTFPLDLTPLHTHR